MDGQRIRGSHDWPGGKSDNKSYSLEALAESTLPPRREGIKRGNREKNRNKNNKVPFPFHLNWLSVILHKLDFKLLLCNLWEIILN